MTGKASNNFALVSSFHYYTLKNKTSDEQMEGQLNYHNFVVEFVIVGCGIQCPTSEYLSGGEGGSF